jgi:hypothetical protein
VWGPEEGERKELRLIPTRAPRRTRIAGGGLGGCAFFALLGLAAPALAAELDAGNDDVSLEVHGFVSQGAMISTANKYLTNSTRGSLEFAELGVNFQSQLTDRLRVGFQLFTRDLGPIGNYQMRADWFNLDYRWRDWLGVRAGRIKVPFGLYNDVSDIDAARVWVLQPQSFYPTSNREYLLAQTGVEVYGYVDLRRAGALDYRSYLGTIFIDISNNPTVRSLDSPYIVGSRLIWETPVQGLRLAGSAQALRLNFQYLLDPTMPSVGVGLDAQLGAASIEFVRRDLVLAAELAQWRVVIDEADLPVLGPEVKHVTVSDHGYVSASYHLAPWFWPGAYYSVLFPDEANATFTGPSKDMQHDAAATVRFDLNAHWILKLEAHYLHGTAALSAAMNGNTPLNNLTRDWALFLAKTTAYF